MTELTNSSPKNKGTAIKYILIGLATIILGYIFLIKPWFYSEPGYVYHVRTVLGDEQLITDVGWNYFPFGRYNSWKRAMTVQALKGSSANSIRAESDSANTSASLPPMSIMFLDQVDAHAETTVRFSIPTEEESFLKLAHEYRTPENLLRTALMPAFKETLQANASLMTAEEYYAGGRTEFNSEFENQMGKGIFLVKREEIRVKSRQSQASANASLGTDQESSMAAAKPFLSLKKYGTVTASPNVKNNVLPNLASRLCPPWLPT
ncbi:hypothetical protein MNBD_GAMMA09-2311 [hydrothermal vent metagenome]|uniref:Uncharacterized protein n=1 Tax=hydrothermal vent metagenome TaxID=652676 RepID=A0A3B0Y002_9ZZZZ